MRQQKPGRWFWIDDAVLANLADLGPVPFAVYCVLAKHAGRRTQECWVAAGTMAGMIGRSERTVRRALRALERAGLVESRARFGPRGQLANLFTLCEPADTSGPRHQVTAPPKSPLSPMSGAPCHPCPGPPVIHVRGPLSSMSGEPEVEEPEVGNQTPYGPPPGDMVGAFERAYGSAERPAYVARALERATAAGHDLRVIVRRAAQFRASAAGMDPPSALAWIRGQRWLEDPASWGLPAHEVRRRATRRLIDGLPARDGEGLPDDWRRQVAG